MTRPRAAEDVVAQQRAQAQAAPNEEVKSGGGLAQIAVAAALAAAQARLAVAAVEPAPAVAGGALTLAEATAKILDLVDAWLAERRRLARARVAELLQTPTSARRLAIDVRGSLTVDDAVDIAAQEDERQAAFAQASRERVRRDLPAALAITDPEARRTAVADILRRETRFGQQSIAAMEQRVDGAKAKAKVLAASPDGAFWRLTPELDNCEVCQAMAGKVWPWSVLGRFYPPRPHPNCACDLLSIEDAVTRGLLPEGFTVETYEAFQALRIVEAAAHDDRSDACCGS